MGRFKRSRSKKKKLTGKEYFIIHFNSCGTYISDPNMHERITNQLKLTSSINIL